MSITLYKHNQQAHDAALPLMEETGKAAVIHPTGTGKSFVGFKLAEEHPEALICWLSPSEYIYKTQVENLKAVTDDYAPENICFMTYTKLMMSDENSIENIQPDYIVLDEFHRCGAVEWGKGVKRLLTAYPDVPILGLSATNIRYLDSQRDMADELFDGNVASEMTLGEAIVRNILLPPIYVTSIYSYQKDLEKYQRKIKKTKNKLIRDAAQKYLDELRRTLTKADGLDVIFDKHIKDRHGKFIVFCANVDHMNEMIERVPEWFGKVDSNPHIYSVHAEDSASEKEFQAFKQDNSNHLKLLFCIDMLNEGVHVEDISGVILFRPTVSPIIYKQQIGRALSANKSNEPIIFDIVNNFENLHSIDGIWEEMREAVNYYRKTGKEESIINSKFLIIDEAGDCKRVFDELQDMLTASWDVYFELAKSFYEEYRHLNIPISYVSQKLMLGKWIYVQRCIKKGTIRGVLSESRLWKLESIGMIWEVRDMLWNIGIEHAKSYNETFGDLLVPYNYVCPDGYKLGRWIGSLRQSKNSKKRRRNLSEDRIQQLDKLGMVWNHRDNNFEKNFTEAEKYYREKGDLLVPAGYSQNGISLGRWIFELRASRKGRKRIKLNKEYISRLDSIGMVWDLQRIYEEQWERGFTEAERYYKVNKSLKMPRTAVTESGFPIGKWVHYQRVAYIGTKGRKPFTPEKIMKLESIGMTAENIRLRK